MKLYRLMSKLEFDSVSEDRPFSWNSKFKWFSPNKHFIIDRVNDGKFNNSSFKKERYTHLVEYLVEDSRKVLKTVSEYERMLSRKDEPLLTVLQVSKIGELDEIHITKQHI